MAIFPPSSPSSFSSLIVFILSAVFLLLYFLYLLVPVPLDRYPATGHTYLLRINMSRARAFAKSLKKGDGANERAPTQKEKTSSRVSAWTFPPPYFFFLFIPRRCRIYCPRARRVGARSGPLQAVLFTDQTLYHSTLFVKRDRKVQRCMLCTRI